MVHELDRAGIEHITMPVDSKNPFCMRVNADRLSDLCYARKVDIVHARSRAPAWSALWAARRRDPLRDHFPWHIWSQQR